MPIDRGRLDAETSRDLLGVHMRVNQPEAFALSGGQTFNWLHHAAPTPYSAID